MKLSLKYKIATVIFFLEAVMMTAVLWQTLGHAVDSAKRQIDAAEQVTLDIVSKIGRVAILNEDYDRVQGYIETLPHNPNILKAVLSDERGVIVASSSLNDLGEDLPELENTENTHWRVHALNNIAGSLGALSVLFSDKAQLGTYKEAFNRGIAIAAIGMSLIAVFGVGFGYLLTLRLQNVVHAAEKVTQGDYSVRTGLKETDEVGQVGTAFDTMADVIAKERQALAEANRDLEQRVRERTQELEEANHEYEAFAYAVSHDLRAPLRSINGFARALTEDYAPLLDGGAKDHLSRIQNSAVNMAQLIDDLLKLSRINRAEIGRVTVNMSRLCEDVVNELRSGDPERDIAIEIQPGITAQGDPQLLRDVLANLVGNAWKFTSKSADARIQFSSDEEEGITVYKVEDNGAGFDPAHADTLFMPFKRLHPVKDFPGTGIGLSTVQRIIHRHGGSIWASGEKHRGATFLFTLGAPKP